jgi:hypothetical protein
MPDILLSHESQLAAVALLGAFHSINPAMGWLFAVFLALQRNDAKIHSETTYHYNGYDTIKKKANLALDNGFGGMMLWEAGHDAGGPHSLTAAISSAMENPPAKYYSLKK